MPSADLKLRRHCRSSDTLRDDRTYSYLTPSCLTFSSRSEKGSMEYITRNAPTVQAGVEMGLKKADGTADGHTRRG